MIFHWISGRLSFVEMCKKNMHKTFTIFPFEGDIGATETFSDEILADTEHTVINKMGLNYG